MLTLDHIVIAAETLSAGQADVETALGLPLQPGGHHDAMGTHNKLLSLGSEDYFELIAIDPNGRAPDQPRWYDLDTFSGATRTTNWACRCADLDTALAAAPAGVGVPWDLARGDLRWRMAVPGDGKLPFANLFPAVIEWQGSAHPAERLADVGVRLIGLELHSPEAEALSATLSPLISDPRISIHKAETPKIVSVLKTPQGDVRI